LLRRCGQAAIIFRPQPHHLDCVHHVGLLREERVAKIRCPANIAIQERDHIRKANEKLDAWIPILLPGRIDQRLPLQIPVQLQPLGGFYDFERVRGGGEDLTEVFIRIESDGRHQIIQLVP
jgi:hypothetical protein